jgi:4'-phosphopantetheinyl transferase EntD
MNNPAGLFPPGVVLETLSLDDCDGELFPVESEAVARALPLRRMEFAAGRTCARRALQKLGIGPVPIPKGAGRDPVWPPGITGSITHDREICAVAVARNGTVRSLGIDLEKAVPLPADLIPDVCAPGELERFDLADPPASCGWPKILFAAKEAVFKCVFPLTRQLFEFHAVELEPAGERSELRVSQCRAPGAEKIAADSFRIRLTMAADRLLVGCWLD